MRRDSWEIHPPSTGATNSPGCHLGTLAENEGAIDFFERCGFVRHGAPIRVPGMRTPEGARMHEQLMVISLLDEARGPGAGG